MLTSPAFPPPTRENTCALVVSYNPDEGVGECLRRAKRIVGRVVVVDNGSSGEPLARLEKAVAENGGTLIPLPENKGIAAGLNAGFRWIREHGYLWVLTLDQDTEPQDELLTNLAGVYERHPHPGEIAVLGANFVDPRTRRPGVAWDEKSPDEWREVPSVITAGCVTSLAAFEKAGPFREDLFIDQVDHEFCRRVRHSGYRVVFHLRPSVLQTVGSRSSHSFFGRSVETRNHSPLRRYYWTRNSLRLKMENRESVRPFFIRLLKETAKIVLFEDRKASKVVSMALGVWHALLGRMGKLQNKNLSSDSR